MDGIAQRVPATGVEAAISITRSVTHHRLGIRLRFAGRLDARRLERAVRLSLDAEPILGCAFRTDAFRPYWLRRDDLEAISAFSEAETIDAEKDFNIFQAAEVPDPGPQVHVRLLHAAHQDDVAIKISHVVADGQATKQYAYLLASLYTDLGLNPDLQPEPNRTRRPGGMDVWQHLDAEQRRSAKKAKSWVNPTWAVPFGSAGEQPTWALLSLEPPEFSAIKSFGKERSATVNDMLLAAVFRACAEQFGATPGVAQAFMCTADLRRFLPNPAAVPICNLSISGSLEIDRVDGETFEETLSRVKASMAQWAGTCYGAGPLAASERLASLGYRAMRTLLTAGFKLGGRSDKTYQWFTNIGIIDESQLHFDAAVPEDAYIVGPVAPGNVVPTVSSYRDRLRIALGYCSSDCEPAVVDGLLGTIREELATAAAQQLPALAAQ